MYIVDTNVFLSLGNYYPKRFPTIWGRINDLADNGILKSVREVKNEIEHNCQHEHIAEWVKNHHAVFLIPTEAELMIIRDFLQIEQYRELVKRQNILKGLPVADPFIIAAGKFYKACVVTQESLKTGARIPNLCKELDISCINLEGFLELENLIY
jgi:hypothetical protein